VTAARKQQEVIKFVEKRVGAALFIGEVLALSALNFSLYTTLMEIAEERAKIRAKIEHLQTIRFAPGEIGSVCGSIRAQWTEFNILPSRETARSPEGMHQFAHLLWSGKRLAMIGKWKRNEATTTDPTTDTAKDDAV